VPIYAVLLISLYIFVLADLYFALLRYMFSKAMSAEFASSGCSLMA
jgi:hypothetical protein